MARDLKPILNSILSAAASKLNAADVAPGRVVLSPGTTPAWDDCCDGQLTLRVIEMYPTAPFPQFDQQQRGADGGCLHMLDLHLGLSAVRCAHTIDSNGVVPTPAQVTEDGNEMADDAMLLLDAIVCDIKELPGLLGLKLGRWQPTPETGGCHGGEWDFHVAIAPCLCQE